MHFVSTAWLLQLTSVSTCVSVCNLQLFIQNMASDGSAVTGVCHTVYDKYRDRIHALGYPLHCRCHRQCKSLVHTLYDRLVVKSSESKSKSTSKCSTLKSKSKSSIPSASSVSQSCQCLNTAYIIQIFNSISMPE